jgi:hypothetical protein
MNIKYLCNLYIASLKFRDTVYTCTNQADKESSRTCQTTSNYNIRFCNYVRLKFDEKVLQVLFPTRLIN